MQEDVRGGIDTWGANGILKEQAENMESMGEELEKLQA